MKFQKDTATEAERDRIRWITWAPLSPGLVRDLTPAVAALAAAIIFSFFFGRSHTAWQPAIIMRGILRFFRITVALCIPLCVLFPVYRFIIEWKRDVLLRVEQNELVIQPVKHWLERPFQGIGIAFLFRTKLLIMLQLIGGPAMPVSLFARGGLGWRQTLLASAVIAFASLLLSTLWTLDDVGIRYANRRSHELKMIGKYVGTVMPLVFGTYGVIGLMANYPTAEALLAVLKAVFVLYPPFACFTVLHTYLIRGRRGFIAMGNTIEEGGVWRRGG
jgi:hypothetical protein